MSLIYNSVCTIYSITLIILSNYCNPFVPVAPYVFGGNKKNLVNGMGNDRNVWTREMEKMMSKTPEWPPRAVPITLKLVPIYQLYDVM